MNTSKWEFCSWSTENYELDGATYSITGGYLEIDAPNDRVGEVRSIESYPRDMVIHYKIIHSGWQEDASGKIGLCYGNYAFDGYRFVLEHSSYRDFCIKKLIGGNDNSGTVLTENASISQSNYMDNLYFVNTITNEGTLTQQLTYNGNTYKITGNDGEYSGKQICLLSSETYDVRFDYVFAKKYSSSEPITTLLSEEWQDAWHDADGNEFSSRKQITISGHTEVLTDFQIKLNITYDSGMQADFSDLRFVYIHNEKYFELSYWIESYTESAEATMWVKIPSLEANVSRTIYMYYGNSSVSSKSNGNAVFEFFDDFNGTNLDLTKWKKPEQLSVSFDDGVAKVGPTTTDNKQTMRSYITFGTNTVFTIKYKHENTSYSDAKYVGYCEDNDDRPGDHSNCIILVNSNYYNNGTKGYSKYSRAGALSQLINSYSNGSWFTSSVIRKTDEVVFQENGNNATILTNVPSINLRVGISVKNINSDYVNVDYIFVRKYADPSPTATIGSEEPYVCSYAGFPKGKWVLMGIPVVPCNGNPDSVLADDFNNTSAGSAWRLSQWSIEHNTYIRYNETDADGQEHGNPPDLYPGRGYWLYQEAVDNATIDVRGYSVPQDQDFEISLNAPQENNSGLNMVANPHNFKIDWSNSKVSDGTEIKSVKDAASAGWMSQYAYVWDSENSQYITLTPNDNSNADSISVWQGFWTIQLSANRSCKLHIPATRVLSRQSPPMPEWVTKHLASEIDSYSPLQKTMAGDVEDSWFLKLGVKSNSENIMDTYNGLGVAFDALDGYDFHDAFEITPSTSKFVMLYFPHDDSSSTDNFWADQPFKYTYDIRSTDFDQPEWLFKVYQYNNPGEYTLNWSGMRLIPQTIKLSFYDAETGEELVSDLRQVNEYSFNLSNSSRAFKIVAESVADTQTPEFTIGITQNPVITDDIDIYVLPSERVTNIEATVNDAELNIGTIDYSNFIYKGKYELDQSGIVTIHVSGTDLSGNAGEDEVAISAQLIKPLSSGTLTSSDNIVNLTIPEKAINKDKYLIIFSEEGEDESGNLIAMTQSYRINPGIQFLSDVELYFKYSENNIPKNSESSLGIYYRDGSEWVLVQSVIDRSNRQVKTTINKTGVYRLFYAPGKAVSQIIPDKYTLEQNYPNPFNSTTVIRYQLPKESRVRITLYNIMGQEVAELVNDIHEPGYYSITWDGSDRNGCILPSGVYLYRFVSSDYCRTRKLVLVK